MSDDRPLSIDELAGLLASALGQEKSSDVVTATARRIGIARTSLSAAEVRTVFDELASIEGLVGVVARVALSRGHVERLITRGVTLSVSSQQRFAALKPSRAHGPVDIVSLLVPALGAEKAREAIEHAASRCGVDASAALSRPDTLRVLDELAYVEGIVGVVARFAKARFLLSPEE